MIINKKKEKDSEKEYQNNHPHPHPPSQTWLRHKNSAAHSHHLALQRTIISKGFTYDHQQIIIIRLIILMITKIITIMHIVVVVLIITAIMIMNKSMVVGLVKSSDMELHTHPKDSISLRIRRINFKRSMILQVKNNTIGKSHLKLQVSWSNTITQRQQQKLAVLI